MMKILLLKNVIKSIFLTVVIACLSQTTINAQNLISNGDFELHTPADNTYSEFSAIFNDWDMDITDNNRNNTRDVRYSPDGGISSSKAAIIFSKSGNTKGKLWQVVNGIDSSKTYVYSVYIKAGNAATEGEPFTLLCNALNEGVNNGNKNIVSNGTSEYVRYGFPVIINAKYDAIKAQIQCNPGGDVNTQFYIDNASLVETSEFVNLDFEEGVDYVWRKTLKGTASVTNEGVEVNSGSNAANLAIMADGDSALIHNDIRVPISNGKMYTVSAMAKVLTDNGDLDSINVITKTYTEDHDLANTTRSKYDISALYESYSHTCIPDVNEKYMTIQVLAYSQVGNYIIDDVEVVEEIANSVGDKIETNDLKIYPNPTTNIITVDYTKGNKASIKIYDTTGKVVVSKVNLQPNNQVDLSALSKGVYIVELVTDVQTSISKVIKK
ncbi:T9SS type A sorting domain-containing protein [Labilibacter sediminis]|nr:T9SS type A sorting domain-containing protein [Labilibacter sediminis]